MPFFLLYLTLSIMFPIGLVEAFWSNGEPLKPMPTLTLELLATHAFIKQQAQLIVRESPQDKINRLQHLTMHDAIIYYRHKGKLLCTWSGCLFHGSDALTLHRNEIIHSVALLASCNNNVAAAYFIAGLRNQRPYGLLPLAKEEFQLVQKLLETIVKLSDPTLTHPNTPPFFVRVALQASPSKESNQRVGSLLLDSGVLSDQDRYWLLMNLSTIPENVLIQSTSKNHYNWEQQRFDLFKAFIEKRWPEAALWLSTLEVLDRDGSRGKWANQIFLKSEDKLSLIPLLGDFLAPHLLLDYIANLKKTKKCIKMTAVTAVSEIIGGMSFERAEEMAGALVLTLRNNQKIRLLSLINPLSKLIRLRTKEVSSLWFDDIVMHPLADTTSRKKAQKFFLLFPEKFAHQHKGCIIQLLNYYNPGKRNTHRPYEGLSDLITYFFQEKNQNALRDEFFAVSEKHNNLLWKKWPPCLMIQALSSVCAWKELKILLKIMKPEVISKAITQLSDEQLKVITNSITQTYVDAMAYQMPHKTIRWLENLVALWQKQTNFKTFEKLTSSLDAL